MKLRQQFFYNLRPGTTRIEGKIPLTSGGAVGTVSIPGVRDVTKETTGVYRIDLDEKYLGLVGWSAALQNATTDSYGFVLKDDSFVDGGEGVHAAVNQYDGYAVLQVIQADGTGGATLCEGMAIWFALDLKTSERG